MKQPITRLLFYLNIGTYMFHATNHLAVDI